MTEETDAPPLSRAARDEAKEIATWCDEQASQAVTTANQQLVWVLGCLAVGLVLLLFLPRILLEIDYLGREESLPPKVMKSAEVTSVRLIENLKQLEADQAVAKKRLEQKTEEKNQAVQKLEDARSVLGAGIENRFSIWEEVAPNHILNAISKLSSGEAVAIGHGRGAAYPKVFVFGEDGEATTLPFLPRQFESGGRAFRFDFGGVQKYLAIPNGTAAIWTNKADQWQQIWPAEGENFDGEISSVVQRRDGTLVAAGWFRGGSRGDRQFLLHSEDGEVFSRPNAWQESLPAVGRLFSILEDEDRLLISGSLWDTTDKWRPSVPPGETRPFPTGTASLVVFELSALDESVTQLGDPIGSGVSIEERIVIQKDPNGTFLAVRERTEPSSQFPSAVSTLPLSEARLSVARVLLQADRLAALRGSSSFSNFDLSSGLLPIYISGDATSWTSTSVVSQLPRILTHQDGQAAIIGTNLNDLAESGVDRRVLTYDADRQAWVTHDIWPFGSTTDIVWLGNRVLTNVRGNALLSVSDTVRRDVLGEVLTTEILPRSFVFSAAVTNANEDFATATSNVATKTEELEETQLAFDRIMAAVKRQSQSVLAFGDLRPEPEEPAESDDSFENLANESPQADGDTAQTFARQLENALRSAEPVRQLAQIATRLAVIALIVYLVQIFVNRYRYLVRLSGFYRARAQAMRVLAAQPKGDFLRGVTLNDLTDLLSPDGIGFDKSAEPPTNQMVSLLQAGLKKT